MQIAQNSLIRSVWPVDAPLKIIGAGIPFTLKSYINLLVYLLHFSGFILEEWGGYIMGKNIFFILFFLLSGQKTP